MRSILLGFVATLILVAGAAHAHHGWSSYDMNQPLLLSGTVSDISYRYPHATLTLHTADKIWTAVLAPPSRMSVRGLPSGAIKAGDSVRVEGYPSRRHPDEMRVTQLTVGGRTVGLR